MVSSTMMGIINCVKYKYINLIRVKSEMWPDWKFYYFLKIGKEGEWAQWALYHDKQQRWKILHSHHITFSGARENQEERN